MTSANYTVTSSALSNAATKHRQKQQGASSPDFQTAPYCQACEGSARGEQDRPHTETLHPTEAQRLQPKTNDDESANPKTIKEILIRTEATIRTTA